MHHIVKVPFLPAQNYSLLGLMYAQQYTQYFESKGAETLQNDILVSHIADFCDCV